MLPLKLIDVGLMASLGEFNLSGDVDSFSATLVGYIDVVAATSMYGYIIVSCSRKEWLSETFLLPAVPAYLESWYK